jgi:pSer/pThr/pTyr-binding forkhead associated (FHA) protein
LAVLAFATGERVEVVSPRVVLGRNPAQEGEGTQLLRLPDPGRAVSRNHALLELVDGRWFITDLQSTNGTYAVMGNRDVQLPAGRPVEVRGAVRIGGYEVAFAS